MNKRSVPGSHHPRIRSKSVHQALPRIQWALKISSSELLTDCFMILLMSGDGESPIFSA